MKRIAVLGAGGFVGSRIVELSILKKEFEVVPIIRTPKSAARIARFGPVWRFADGGKPDELKPLIAGCDAVVNVTIGEFGAMAGMAESVWQSCAQAGVPRLVHMSTAEVFGRVEDPATNDESLPLSKHWMPYALGKAQAEAQLKTHFNDPKVACVILRPGLIWGPRSPWIEGPATEMTKGVAFLIGGGTGPCNLIYVDNLIRQILSVVNRPEPVTGCFNVSDDESLTWHDYYAAIAKELHIDFSEIHQLPAKPFHPTMATRFAEFKQTAPACWLKKRLSRPVKLKIKGVLNMFQTPPPVTGIVENPAPEVTKGAWWLQNVVHKLSNAKFRKTFGRQGEVSFAEAMAASGEWMRFSGFGTTF
jgi:nucleoside-diphosphate-sugar epimerase